jgi:3-dehydroquinate synthase
LEFTKDIFIGINSLTMLEKHLSENKYSSVFILTDENVNRECFPVLQELCKPVREYLLIEIPAGEEEKNLTTSAKILSALLENNADRNCLLINFGGGVLCDTGGFVAAIYKRGIKFINVPTTLLAMVDASSGGKNGINFLGRKNIIGTFTKPEGVFIFPEFLNTLNAIELRSGYAEIIKHILLSNAGMWNKFKNDASSLMNIDQREALINHSIEFKSKIVSEDFKETGLRKQLNFGHTFGHALESFSYSINQPLKHGEAVAIGMIGELLLSSKLCGFPELEKNTAIHLLKDIFDDVQITFSPEDLIPFLYADKKNSHDRIGFSLLNAPGKPSPFLYADIDQIVEGLIFMSEEFSGRLHDDADFKKG